MDRLLVLPALASAFVIAAAACGGSTHADVPPSDGGSDARSSDDPAPGDDGGAADAGRDADAGGVQPTRLAEGAITLYGITTDDHAIYTKTESNGDRTLEALDLATGVARRVYGPIADGSLVDVKGNAVALWSGVAPTGFGMLSLWRTDASSITLNIAQALSPYLWASDDGKVIAVFTKPTIAQGIPTAAELSVYSGSTRTDVLTGADRIGMDDASCGWNIGFVKTTLVVAYCTPGKVAARLITVADAATPAPRVLVDDGLTPFWSADETATKILAIARDQERGLLVTNDGTDPAPSAPIATGLKQGFMMKDGSAIVYRTETALRRTAIAGGVPGAPVTIAADEARGIVDVSADQTSILFRSMPGKPVDPQDPDGERYFDLRAIAPTTTNGAATVLVDSERALAFGFTANGAHALYFANGPSFNAVATDGSGEEKTMPLQFNGLRTRPSGSGVVLEMNDRVFEGKTVFDLVHVDLAAGGPGAGPMTRVTVAESVPSTGFRFGVKSPSKLVYVRAAASAPGLYSVTLP